MDRRGRILLIVALAMTCGFATTGETRSSHEGGSGLVRIEDAWSLPFTGFLIGVHGGYFDNNFTPGTSRLVELTPSLTKGLGSGFEFSAAWPLEGLTSNLTGEQFDRRFDLRARDPLAKLRWTHELGHPRVRGGILGSVVLPVSEKTRPGGTIKPSNTFDFGAQGLLSADLGVFRAPIRLHINSGYWWSRNDGAFFYRGLPTALPLAVEDGQSNNVFDFGVALEAGFQRFVAFAELTTQQLWDARAEINGAENYWRLTPGVRTELTSTIGLTAAMSFDLSKNIDGTTFDPTNVFPDVEFRVGLTMGQVLDRLRSSRQPSMAGRVSSATAPSAAVEEPPAAPVPSPPQQTVPVVAQPAKTAPAIARAEAPAVGAAPAPTTSPATSVLEQRLLEVTQRLAQLETLNRLSAIESRIASLESSGSIAARTRIDAPPSPQTQQVPAAPAPQTAPATQAAPSTESAAAPSQSTPEVVTSSVADSDASAEMQTAAGASATTPELEKASVEGVGDPRVDALMAQVAELTTSMQSVIRAQGQTLQALQGAPASSTTDAGAAGTAAASDAAATSKAAGVGAPLGSDTLGAKTASSEPVAQAATPDLALEVQRLEAQIRALQQRPLDRSTTTTQVVPGAQGATFPLVQQSVVVPPADSRALDDRIATRGTRAPAVMPSLDETSRLKAEVAAELQRSRSLRDAPVEDTAPAAIPTPSEAPTQATDELDPADVDASASAAQPTSAAQRTRRFPLSVGQTRVLVENAETTAVLPEVARAQITELASSLQDFPEVRVILMVHGGSSDNLEALRVSEQSAATLREALVQSGARPEQVVALGMGLSAANADSKAHRIEVQRVN